MKKTLATLIVIVIAVASLHAVRVMRQSTISGKISPADAVEVVIAINGTDSLKLKPSEGAFSFIVQPGAWKVWIDANMPSKDTTLGAVGLEGDPTELGALTLQH